MRSFSRCRAPSLGIALIAGMAAAAPGIRAQTPPPAALSATPEPLNIRNAPYGAKGDGTTDDTDAIGRALTDAARSVPPRAVYAPAGSYRYSGNLKVAGVTLTGDAGASGPATVFVAADPAHSALVMSGDGARLLDCKITCPGVTPGVHHRSNASNTAGVYVDGATNFVIHGITVDAVASAGIICATHPSRCGFITGNTIRNTLADGIHITHGSHDIVVDGNTVENSGDDMIAVVSYVHDGAPASHVTITNNRCLGQTWGRGITVVGGEWVTICGNTIRNSNGAGILLASEKGYQTFAVHHVTVAGNEITAPDRAGPDPNSSNRGGMQGGIFVNGWSTDFPITDITLVGNTVREAPYVAVRIGHNVSEIRQSGNVVEGRTAPLFLDPLVPLGATVLHPCAARTLPNSASVR